MMTLRPVLLILGLLCLVASSFQVQAPRVNLQSLGLAFWLFAVLVA